MSEAAKKIVALFESMISAEDEVKEIKSDIKDAIEMYCLENDHFTPKAIKSGFVYFKKLIKDRGATQDDESQREKIIEIISELN